MNDPSDNPDFIDLQSDTHFMQEALRQARRAYAAEEVPVGAVIVRDSQIIARAFNQVETLHDATAHAEMLALTQAESVVEDWRLTECDLYVTKEPCAMCAGAIVHCRVRRVIYGCPSEKDGAAGSVLNLLQHEKLNHQCTLTPDVLGDDCAQLLKSFFTEARAKPQNPHSQFPPPSHSPTSTRSIAVNENSSIKRPPSRTNKEDI